MSQLSTEQVNALNEFSRTHPHLAKVFDYTDSGTKEGLGDALNDIAGSSDHGDLTGLLDDDHPQYILVDGTRAFTGDQSLGGNRLTNLGAPVAGTDAARFQDVGPGFYGIMVGQSDDLAIFHGINTIKFETANFYVTQNSPNTDEVQVSFRGSASDHGALTGLSDDDHTQYVLGDGTRNITGSFTMEQHVRIGDTLNVENSVTAEAFYLTPGSGGEISKRGNDLYIRSRDGQVVIDDELRVERKVVAEAYYLKDGLEVSGGLVRLPAQSTTSGTAFDFNLIPTGVRRITVVFDQVGLTGSDDIWVQIGDSGGIETTDYDSRSGTNTAVTASSTSGFVIRMGGAGRAFEGLMTLVNMTGNLWVESHSGDDNTVTLGGGGRKVLSGTLDRVRVTRSGTNTFDEGSVSVLYE